MPKRLLEQKQQLKWFFQCDLWSLSNSRAPGGPVTLSLFLSNTLDYSHRSFHLNLPCWGHIYIYVSLQLCMQNRRRKWHFLLNFRNAIIWTSPFLLNIRNSIIWTSPFPLNVRNAINWDGAFSKAFRTSEALISVLSKNAHLYDNI